MLSAASNLLFALLSTRGHDLTGLIWVISADNLAGGIATAAFIAYLSSLCTLRFTATQYALLSSIAALASHTVGGLSGFAAQALGWTTFYTVAMFSALPSMALMLVILRRFPPEPAKPTD